MSVGQAHADLVDEGGRIADAARQAGIQLPITGGVGVALCCPSARSAPLARPYADIDAVGLGRERRTIIELFSSLGYQPDEQFNALNASSRLCFWDTVQGRHVDVFLDKLTMCHSIDLRDRVGVSERTLPLADLLLLKLQIVETNEKDFLDLLALLIDHEFTPDDSGINITYLAGLCAHDWGLWKTSTTIAARAVEFARDLDGFEHRQRVERQVEHYLSALEEAPKSRGWSLRARIGPRKRWYELPEEVH
jgi:hypothetical protein